MTKPTIKDVAKTANVSIATVSRILNQTAKGYSEKTKQHVLNTIEEMGYFPNAIARGLINKQTGTIGVLFPDVSGLVSAQLLHGIEAVAHSFGQSVIVCNTNSNGEKTLHYLRLLQEKQVEGVIFTSEMLSENYTEIIQQMDIPVVTVSAESEIESIPSVKVNDEVASYEATTFLIDRGHTNIGMLSGDIADPIAGLPRIQGFKRALKEAGLPFVHTQIASNLGFYFEDGRIAYSKLMEDHPNTTAIFAASDEIGVGAISSAYQRGLRIPEDLSVIGYDNTKLAEMVVPPLTTVSQEFETIGRTAAELLFNEIGTGEKSKSMTIQHKIVQRDSVMEHLS